MAGGARPAQVRGRRLGAPRSRCQRQPTRPVDTFFFADRPTPRRFARFRADDNHIKPTEILDDALDQTTARFAAFRKINVERQDDGVPRRSPRRNLEDASAAPVVLDDDAGALARERLADTRAKRILTTDHEHRSRERSGRERCARVGFRCRGRRFGV
jgi:hypothetical protein